MSQQSLLSFRWLIYVAVSGRGTLENHSLTTWMTVTWHSWTWYSTHSPPCSGPVNEAEPAPLNSGMPNISVRLWHLATATHTMTIVFSISQHNNLFISQIIIFFLTRQLHTHSPLASKAGAQDLVVHQSTSPPLPPLSVATHQRHRPSGDGRQNYISLSILIYSSPPPFWGKFPIFESKNPPLRPQ